MVDGQGEGTCQRGAEQVSAVSGARCDLLQLREGPRLWKTLTGLGGMKGMAGIGIVGVHQC